MPVSGAGSGDRNRTAFEPRLAAPNGNEPVLATCGCRRDLSGYALRPCRKLPTGSFRRSGSAAKQEQEERGQNDNSFHAYL